MVKTFSFKAATILSALLFICPLIKAQDQVESTEQRLKGSVKIVRGEYRQLVYRSDKWVEGERLLEYIESYPPVGEIIKRTDYKPDGSTDYEWTPPADRNE